MKKIFSSILALAMMLSLFTFTTANAGSESNFNVSFEQISVASGDMNKLAVGDSFYAVIKLKNVASVYGAGIDLTWNNSALELYREDKGTASTSLKYAATSRISESSDYQFTYYDTEEETDISVCAFEEASPTLTQGTLQYDFSVVESPNEAGVSGYWDYITKTDDVLAIKLRFRVISTTDVAPDFKITRSEYRSSINTTLDTIGSSVDPIGFASATPDPKPTTTDNFFAAAVKTNEKPTLADTLIYTFKNDLGNTGTKDVYLGAEIESDTTINTAVKVTGIPEGRTVTLDSVTWKPWN